MGKIALMTSLLAAWTIQVGAVEIAEYREGFVTGRILASREMGNMTLHGLPPAPLKGEHRR